jgi:dolichol-phosphate mannosyltransferase
MTELSLVIPTFNESSSVGPLLDTISFALGSLDWEAIFVDDSTDDTAAVLAHIAARDARVRVNHRRTNVGGLAGAVVDGLALAQGTYVCVLDADLQHPPTEIPALLAAAKHANAEVVVASRYVRGGSASGLDGPLRQLYSRGLKSLSRLLFPWRLKDITDPLGGFFLIRRDVVDGVQLRPIGYKILLEILVRCQWRVAREVPYRFQPRAYGASKADVRQGVRFLRHLATLVWECSPACRPLRGVA